MFSHILRGIIEHCLGYVCCDILIRETAKKEVESLYFWPSFCTMKTTVRRVLCASHLGYFSHLKQVRCGITRHRLNCFAHYDYIPWCFWHFSTKYSAADFTFQVNRLFTVNRASKWKYKNSSFSLLPQNFQIIKDGVNKLVMINLCPLLYCGSHYPHSKLQFRKIIYLKIRWHFSPLVSQDNRVYDTFILRSCMLC